MSGIKLSGKDLTAVPTDIPRNETVLDLSHNNLVILHRDAFIQLPNLTTLYLHYNEIAIVQYDAFRGLDKLDDLRLDHNNLSVIPDISGLSTLTRLTLSSNNRIQSFNATMFNSMSKLNTLRIESIGAGNVPNFPALNLRHLYLGTNRISSFQSQSLQTLKSLLRLDLEHNKLRALPYLGGIEKNIRYLVLRSNRFYLFPDVSAYSSLQELDLSDNFITLVPEASLAHMQVVDVNLAGNPIVCVTELCWLVSKRWPFTVSVTCPGGTALVNMGQDAICQGRREYCQLRNQKTTCQIWFQMPKMCIRVAMFILSWCHYIMTCWNPSSSNNQVIPYTYVSYLAKLWHGWLMARPQYL